MTGLAAGSSELLQHLLLDRVIKIVIVLAALGVLAAGMTLIWRRVGRTKDRRD
ncbi:MULTISPECIES: hypothetical protein [Streptomyces]|uniref:hypothetical protein n=1 Tax=Streptomyces TaxID=1883 RepID=UPI001962D999|nr:MULTISPECIES: hypothetical protein [Streptomyces]QRX90046.1 hypothetical protein JNO44_03460 [Streptomyces noursei]UJB39980.1 hypothetical protein HRD51_02900 [Streptomyces sp. A1-5]